MGTVREWENRWGVSFTKKQSAFGTPIADVSLTDAIRFLAFSPAKVAPEIQNDIDRFGKGHPYPTEQHVERHHTELAREFDLNSEAAGFILALALGDVVSSQLGATSAYSHVIEPMSTATTKTLPLTTIVEQYASSVKKNIQDLAIGDFSISSGVKDRAKLSANLTGSGKIADSTLTMPSLTATPYLRGDDLKFELGTLASEVDCSLRLAGFEFAFSNDILADDGYRYDGDGYRRELEIGKPNCSVKFGLKMEHDADTELDNLLAQTDLSLIATWESQTLIDTGYYHSVKLEIPSLKYSAAPIASEGGITVWQIEATPMYDATIGAPFKITVQNAQTAYLQT